MRLLDAIQKDVAVLAVASFIEKCQTENQVGRCLSLRNNVQHELFWSWYPMTAVVHPSESACALHPHDIDPGSTKDS